MQLIKALIAVIYMVAVLGLSGCESLFFWPSKQLVPSPEVLKFTKEDKFFTAQDGTLIHGWQIAAQGEKQGTIYFLHGNAQNLSYHVANVFWLAEKGWEIVIIDYRGYGRTAGDPDFAKVQQDALAGYLGVLESRQDQKPVIVWGQSLGASIAINMVAELPAAQRPQGLIVDSTFSSHQKIVRETLGNFWLTYLFQYPLSLFFTDDYAPEQAIARIDNVPFLFVHSVQDPVIDISHAQTLYQLAHDPKQLWVSPVPGHIAAWNDEVWRDHLVCQLNRWPQLNTQEAACEDAGLAAAK
ncbi:alpha/beta hydrolase (plasmid) [Photobacterium sp. GJ3]|uniref:alpha/beta hydrolase n=1 Tax=Photobacterium sp. GJ3 TaxID=2829502 RepID=UPI001B8AC9AB|nr:alpha/beta hydrolase [Photobacterium sp. GJ3]QUJ70156.1 alpha/beta hydrolase [Photobacterium sp. GJ3]